MDLAGTEGRFEAETEGALFMGELVRDFGTEVADEPKLDVAPDGKAGLSPSPGVFVLQVTDFLGDWERRGRSGSVTTSTSHRGHAATNCFVPLSYHA